MRAVRSMGCCRNDGWRCEVCYHTNESLQTSCVFCGATAEGWTESWQCKEYWTKGLALTCFVLFVAAVKVTSSQRQSDSTSAPVATSQSKASARSVSSYLAMTSPRSAWAQGPEAFICGNTTDRQLVARERHQWKRCVGKHCVRWVRLLHLSSRCIVH